MSSRRRSDFVHLELACPSTLSFGEEAPKSIEFFESEECRHYIPSFSIGRVAPEF